MFLSNRIITLTVTLIVTTLAQAKDESPFNLSVFFGGKSTFNQLSNINPQAIPQIAEFDFDCSGVLYDINPAFHNGSSTAGNNSDTLIYQQFEFGIRASYLDDKIRPTTKVSIGPTASIYGLFNGTPANLSALYTITPGFSGGFDAGISAAINGNTLQVGGGGLFYTSTYTSGPLFSKIKNAADDDNANPGDIDSDAFEGVNADTTYVLEPYVYAEVSTELGDVLTVYVKASYGFKENTSLAANSAGDDDEYFKDDDTNQLFAGASGTYFQDTLGKHTSISMGIAINTDEFF